MNRSNICPTDSSSSNERDKKSHCQINTESPLSDICKYLDVQTNKKTSSKENVELALEVEINESLKEVLERDSSGSSELLDVTIIRPSESDTTRETTVALNKDEVRDFISLVEQHHKNRKGTSPNKKETETKEHKFQDDDVTFEKFPPCESENSSKKSYSIRQIATPKNYPTKFRHKTEDEYVNRSALPHKISNEQKQVYATVNNFDKLKSTLSCQNKNKNSDQKPGTPCLCQHCGIIGVLVQSQKGPVAAFPPIDEEIASNESHTIPPKSRSSGKPKSNYCPSPTKDSYLKKTHDLRTKKSVDQVELLKEISARIKILEKRISIQEQTAVPKEYLKHILQKIINQYNYRATTRETTTPVTRLKNSGTQYSSKNIPQREIKHPCSYKHYHTPTDTNKICKGRNYHVNTCLTGSTNPYIFEANKNKPDSPITTKKEEAKPIQTQALPNNISPEKDSPKQEVKDLYWLWGEEIVRPGCDLRNKILHLLEDKIHRSSNNGKVTENANARNRENTQYPNHFAKNSPKTANQEGIKVECDNNTLYLKNVDQMPPINIHEHLKQKETPKPYLINKGTDVSNNGNHKNAELPKPKVVPASDTNKWSRFTTLEFPSNRCTYPFDVKKTLDDSTFRKNIEACKEKVKEKPKLQIEEKYFNSYACQSMSTELQASMDYVAQKIKNSHVMESGLTREREDFINAKFLITPCDEIKSSYIKDKLNTTAFRSKGGVPKNEKSINFTYINPKIYSWSEESSQSEDKFLAPRRTTATIKKEVKCLEKKESLIYKLDFLKNLAKNKSIDQSRVLNRIWNQAKTTARSSKDAVLIKIPIKTISTCDPSNNVVEMELTLEELETVVKTAKSPIRNQTPIKLGYKSSSDVDIGQRRHQEMRKANREILNRNRRQGSAKSKNQR